MTKTATLIEKMHNWKGDANLYKMEPPYLGNDYIIVSAVKVVAPDPYLRVFVDLVDGLSGRGDTSQGETYIFAADSFGLIEDWSELAGSRTVYTPHDEVLADLGYTVVVPVDAT